MELELIREIEDGGVTFGDLYIDGEWVAVTLEDQYRETKVHGDTRIPSGRYEIRLRNEGGMAPRYRQRFGSSHKGMMWLQDVPDFTYVYIHIGNTDEDTKGCILVGNDRAPNNAPAITGSGDAYASIYPRVTDAIKRGELVTITICDDGDRASRS